MPAARRFPILHVLEAPSAELEWCAIINGGRARLPLEAHTAMRPEGRRVTALSMDAPALVHAVLKGRTIRIEARWPEGGTPASWFLVRVIGIAVSSPPPWETHSRREYQANKRAFERAAPKS